MKKKINWENIKAYIQGNLRYKLWYSKRWKFLIRSHIKQQIIYRINSMKVDCFNEGACIRCGCKTINLQLSNKACEGFCYPKMMNKKDWLFHYKGHTTIAGGHVTEHLKDTQFNETVSFRVNNKYQKFDLL